MATITTKDGAQIVFKEWGDSTAQPIVFHHGWPLSADEWDSQMLFFLSHGYRVIAHDRRGHGRSSQTDTGNEMDTYASDVAELVKALISRAQSMSGTRLAVAKSRGMSRVRKPAGSKRPCSSALCRPSCSRRRPIPADYRVTCSMGSVPR